MKKHFGKSKIIMKIFHDDEHFSIRLQISVIHIRHLTISLLNYYLFALLMQLC